MSHDWLIAEESRGFPVTEPPITTAVLLQMPTTEKISGP